MENEFLVVWRCASVQNIVGFKASSLMNHCWESLFSLLASVETVPAVVHERVKSVIEAFSEIIAVEVLGNGSNVEWLG
jgi:hypothetical protein